MRTAAIIWLVAVMVGGLPYRAEAKGRETHCPGYMKPGADVCLSAPLTVHLKPGETEKVVPVRLLGSDSERVQWQVLSTQLAALLTKKTVARVAKSDVPLENERYLRIKAPKDGFAYVRLRLTSGQGNTKRVRVIAIPVVVGDADPRSLLKRPGRLMQGPDGEPVISMQGQ